MIALLLALNASAIQVEQGVVPCPIGGAPTRVHRLLSRNQAGWDSDGARYTSGGQWRDYQLATCPDNLLSLYSKDMIRPLDDDKRPALEALLATIGSEVSDPDALQLWDRYAHAARAYEALGAGDWKVGNAYLRASWAVRDAIVGAPYGLRGPAMQRALYERGKTELRREMDATDRKTLLFNLARVAHRLGLSEERELMVSELDRFTELTPAEAQVRTALHELPAREAELQDAALVYLARVTTGPEAPEARYLQAELLRRRGRVDEARPLFEAVARDDKARDELAELARFMLADLDGEQPWISKGPALQAP